MHDGQPLLITIAAFITGAALMLMLVMATEAIKEKSGNSETAAADGGPNAEGYYCKHHRIHMETDEDAREHAVEYHGAPKEGDVWKETYKDRGETTDGVGSVGLITKSQ